LFLSVSLLKAFNDALYLLIPLFVLIVLRSFLPVILPLKLRQALIWLFLIILFVQPVNIMLFNRAIKFNNIGELIKSNFSGNKEKNVVITDIVLKRIAPYYLEFDTANTRFISYFEAQNFNFNNEKVYILINDYTTWMSEMVPERTPLFILNFRDSAYKIVDTTFKMKLYEIPNHELLLVNGKQTKFVNNFESDMLSQWNINPATLTKEKYFTVSRSNIISGQGYSSTLVVSLKDLISDSTVWLDVTLATTVNLTDSSAGQMVVSLETIEGKSLNWLGKPLRNEIRNSNEWNRIAYTNRILMPQDSTRNIALFKIYFWNNSYKPFYIDDVEVKFKCVNHL
jgi:hypothetical protein